VRYLIDADSAIDHLTRHASLFLRIPDLAPHDLALSAITLIELQTGVVGSATPREAERELRRFLKLVTLVPTNRRVIDATARLRADLLGRRRPIAHRAYDLIVAATAIEYRLTVVSSNERDYLDIVGLQLLNPRSG